MNPVQHRAALRKAFKGVVGRARPTDEDRAMRAAVARFTQEQRDKIDEAKGLQRLAAVARRKKHQMLAAEYARDRRANE